MTPWHRFCHKKPCHSHHLHPKLLAKVHGWLHELEGLGWVTVGKSGNCDSRGLTSCPLPISNPEGLTRLSASFAYLRP